MTSFLGSVLEGAEVSIYIGLLSRETPSKTVFDSANRLVNPYLSMIIDLACTETST